MMLFPSQFKVHRTVNKVLYIDLITYYKFLKIKENKLMKEKLHVNRLTYL